MKLSHEDKADALVIARRVLDVNIQAAEKIHEAGDYESCCVAMAYMSQAEDLAEKYGVYLALVVRWLVEEADISDLDWLRAQINDLEGE